MIETYAGFRSARIFMALTGSDYPLQPRRRVLMKWYPVYGGFRKPGTVDNTAMLRKFFRQRHEAQDARIDRELEIEND